MVAVVLAVTVAAGSLAPTPASACSLVGPTIHAPTAIAAGATIRVTGEHLFRVEGTLEADCGGDWEPVALEGLVLRATFTTVDRPPVIEDIAVTVVVSDADDDGFSEFTFDQPVDIPDDATSAALELVDTGAEATVAITGAVISPTVAPSTGAVAPTTVAPTTVAPTTAAPATIPPGVDPAAPPAEPIEAAPTFTG